MICRLFAITLIWVVQNYFQLLLRPIISSIAIHFCMVSQTLTSPNLNLFRIDSTGPRCDKVTSIYSVFHYFIPSIGYQYGLEYCLTSVLLTYKMLHEEQPVYLHSMLATALPSCSLRSSKGISLSFPRFKINTVSRVFHSCALSLWNSLMLPVCSAISVATFKKHLKTHPFHHRHCMPNGPLMLRN